MKFKLLTFVLTLATVSGFDSSANAEDKFEPMLSILSGGIALRRVAERENVKVTRLSGSDSSVPHHSYMAIRPYRVRIVGEASHPMKSFRESFIKNLASELVADMRKIGLDVNYSKDFPYKDGASWGSIRVKTKRGDDPPLAAMIDVRLFVVSDNIAFVTATIHIMYLSDPDMVPNLLPEKMPTPQTDGPQPATQ